MKTVGLEWEGVCAVSSVASGLCPGWGQSMVGPGQEGSLARLAVFP